MFIVSGAQMLRLDALAQDMDISNLILMENAGRALAEQCEKLLSGQMRKIPHSSYNSKCGTIAVLAGPGQNGGDGFCAARHLASKGYRVKVGFFGRKSQLRNAASINWNMLKRYPVNIYCCEFMEPHEVTEHLGNPDLIIDALLGIGAKGSPRFPIDVAIRWANSQKALLVACDVPSGVSADTGYAHSVCIRADLTVTMGFAKVGLFSYPGRMYSGKIFVEHLAFPPKLMEEYCCKSTNDNRSAHIKEVFAQISSIEQAASLLPKRKADYHKGHAGHVVVIAGSVGMSGAAVLAAKSALRAGAGTVTLFCPNEIYNICASSLPEIMVIPYGSAGMFYPKPECISLIERHIEKANSVVIGPGWGRGYFQTQFLKEILSFASKKAFIVDADAFFALKQLGGLSYLADIKGNFILTPHPGEMSMLTGVSTKELEKDRPGYAKEVARLSNSIVCLKGAGTCTASPQGRLCINTSGGPGMATAGSGDVLTGVIAALVAQGLSTYASSWLGVFWHGIAGEIAFERKGSYGLLAGDIADNLPRARAQIEQKFNRY